MPELAIDYAQAGGDVERVNRLILLHAQRAFAAGRRQTVRRWFAWFEDENLLAEYPAVAVLGAMFYINVGDAASAERWAVAADHPSSAPVSHGTTGARSADRLTGFSPTGARWRAGRAVLRGFQCRDGISAAGRDAEMALAGLHGPSGFQAAALITEARSLLLLGQAERADLILPARSTSV